ncbi:MAG: DNA repair exonuclease [Sulfolobales archaeon]|nr:DNA repair exonuclease [Sulfolobales archaeon]MCX8186154.1 DNA repair exonuclease [Sulfolobales archaeon]MDW7969449.1 DNA repair exonuclease [Sulfolobales archaeon]
MLLLHVSDTHLGSNKPSKTRERELDFYEVFDEVIDIAIREGVDAIIHCGDLFDDPKPSPQAYFYAFKSLRRLREAGIDFLVVAGQHDQPKTSALSPLRVLEEVGLAKVLATFEPWTGVIKLKGNELGITAIPYADPQGIQELIKVVKRPNASKRVVMAHLLLKELNLPVAHLSLNELRIIDYNYVALGDYHGRYVTNYGGIPIVYPGSTEAQDSLDSRDERFVALVDIGREGVAVNWVKLSKFRRWLIIKSSTYEELIKRLGEINFSEFLKPPILYAEVSNVKSVNLNAKRVLDYLTKLTQGGKISFYNIKTPNISEELEGPQREVTTSVSTLDSVVHNLLKDPKLSELVLSIIKGSDDVEFVEALINQLMNDRELINKLEKLVKTK